MRRADINLDGIFRAEAGRLVAWLARLLGPGRLALIEDAVQYAFAAALARWPDDGVPDKPAAWLGVAARNKALDRLKREARSAPFDEAMFDEAGAWRLAFADPEAGGGMDDTLALMFVACHPALDHETQTMLTLKTVCGFNVAEVARAYLSTAEAVTQRLVRAKRRIRELGLAFRIPEGDELRARLPALIDAVYLLFNGGYTAREGAEVIAPALCAEALRLAELLAGHPRTQCGACHALAALICLHHARARARSGPAGDLILLADQDRTLWDRDLIARGQAHLAAAMTSDVLTPLHVEAGIAGVHAAAKDFAATDWSLVARGYATLEDLKPTPVVRLNAAIARAYAEGPEAGLAHLMALADERRLHGYALYHAACGDLLHRLNRTAEAACAFGRALDCPANAAEQAHLRRRMEACRAA